MSLRILKFAQVGMMCLAVGFLVITVPLLFEAARLGASALELTVLVLVLTVSTAALCVALPLGSAVLILSAKRLHYYDNGRARAAVVTKPPKRSNGDVKAHTLGAWPTDQHAGSYLGEWVRQEVHATGARVVALASGARTPDYVARGMHVEKAYLGGMYNRIASQPPPTRAAGQQVGSE